MNATQLHKPDGTPTGVYYCAPPGCRTVHPSEEYAAACCVCSECGGPAKRYSKCKPCDDAASAARSAEYHAKQWARAEAAPREPDDYDGPVFEIDGEGYWHSLGEALYDIASECEACSDLTSGCPHAPRLFWGAVAERLTIDIDRVLENVDEGELCEDMDPSEASPELRAAVDAWNADHAQIIYRPSGRVVVAGEDCDDCDAVTEEPAP